MTNKVLLVEKKDQIATLTLNRPKSMNALSTELRDALEAAFADTHARVGIIPVSQLSQKLSRLIGIYRAKEVSLTGNFIDPDQALAWGLVNRVVAPDDLLPTCLGIATDIKSCPDDMIRKYKKLIDDGFQMTFADGVELERKMNTEFFSNHLEGWRNAIPCSVLDVACWMLFFYRLRVFILQDNICSQKNSKRVSRPHPAGPHHPAWQCIPFPEDRP